MNSCDKQQLKITAAKVRLGIIEGVYNAKSGHPGGSLSAADIFTYLYFKELHIDPQNPKDPDRDRFVLSKGHCAPGLYATLAQRGYFSVDELKKLRHIGSLGQGISAAAGMALAGKIDNKDYRVYSLLGDGEIEEGQVWEAAMFASHNNLDNLCLIVDFNGLQIDGPVSEVAGPEPIDKKFEAFGFDVQTIDGHDFDAIEAAFARAKTVKGKPSVIIAKTVKGKGVSYMENQVGWHGTAPNKEQYETAMQELTAALHELEGC